MRRELKDGLILRSLDEGVASDRENMGQFYKDAFGGEGDEDSDELLAWTADLISDAHPQTNLQDFWVVVDSNKDDKIVSAILHIPQTWRYADIDLNAGRIELVATDKDYRNRGLIRAQFEAAHARCEALGQVIQGITGIPHYYRKFGYAMAVDLGGAGWLPLASVPRLKEDAKPDYTLRDASEADIPQLMGWYDAHMADKRLSTVRDEAIWRFEMLHRTKNTPLKQHFKIIVDQDDQGVGYVALNFGYTDGQCRLNEYVVGDKSSYLATFDDVMRAIKSLAENHEGTSGKKPERINFNSGMHPSVIVQIQMSNGHVYESPYAWYIRVADMVGFLKQVTPALERRLAGSGANGYTGEMTLAFHNQSGVKFHFERGRIKDVTAEKIYWADAAFPYDTFLNVLFGHRDLLQIRQALPDAYANKKGRVLIEAMFPRQDSALYGMA